MTMADDELRALVHALRTPLTIVEGFSDLLVRTAPTCRRPSARSTCAASPTAAHEMRAMLDDAVR